MDQNQTNSTDYDDDEEGDIYDEDEDDYNDRTDGTDPAGLQRIPQSQLPQQLPENKHSFDGDYVEETDKMLPLNNDDYHKPKIDNTETTTERTR